MRHNVGPTERYVRIGAGIAALAFLPFLRSRWTAAFLGAVAASGLETGLTGFCPINEALGIDNAAEGVKKALRTAEHKAG